MLPKGAKLILNFITEEEEQNLLVKLVDETWYSALGRRVIHYGSIYRYFPNEPDRDIDAIPDWIPNLSFLKKDFFNQIIVNEYNPGQGIAPHTDAIKQFGDTIVTLSLGSDCVMDLSYKLESIPVLLPRRSLLILQEDARYLWKHGIAKRLKDKIDDVVLTRTKRISITYRHDFLQVTKRKRDEK